MMKEESSRDEQMGYRCDTIFSKSFSRYEQRKLKCWALIASLLISLSFLLVLKPYLVPLPILNLRLSMPTMPMSANLTMLAIESADISQQFVAETPESDVMQQNIELTKEVMEENSEEKKEVVQEEKKENTEPKKEVMQKDTKKNTEQKIEVMKENTEPKKEVILENTEQKKEVMQENTKKNTEQKNEVAKENTERKKEVKQENTEQKKEVMQEKKPLCVSDPRSDFCEMNGDIRIHGNSSNVFVFSSSQMGNMVGNESWKMRPYARKGDGTAMANVRELSLTFLSGHEETPQCTINRSVPAIIFSIGGYTGNLFHDFTDVLIPLYITSRQFQGEVQFLITDFKLWWVNKYKVILKGLSKYEIIDLDRDHRVLCFRGAILGLKCHKELSIDPSKPPIGYSMSDFNKFLRSVYSLERSKAIRIGCRTNTKPRLLIVSRKLTRSFTNVVEIVEMASSLGYEVVVEEPGFGGLSKMAHIVNSCDVMMGVHGAGLTNLVFLPTNAILIQIVPFGGLEWLSRYDFGEPALDMKLRYLQYTIGVEESSLIQQYPPDHDVFKNPMKIHKQGWQALRSIYLDKQNVKLDVGRFKAILLKARKLFHSKN